MRWTEDTSFGDVCPRTLGIWRMTAWTALNRALLYSWLLVTFIPKEIVTVSVGRCLADKSVCGSWLSIGEHLHLNETAGYCTCYRCANRSWDETDPRSFTWYHYERTDWIVQYQFCTPPDISTRICSLDDPVAAIIRVSMGQWDPYLEQSNCRCWGRDGGKQGRYYMDNWLQHTPKEGKDGQGYWEYTYSCDKRQCETKKPCLRHYMDRSSTHTIGFKFLCTCPPGFYCPPRKGSKPQAYEQDGSDHIGPFVDGFCQPVPGWVKRFHN